MKRSNQFRLNAILAVTLCGLVSVANADDPDKLPAAKSVLKKFADVTGGAGKLPGDQDNENDWKTLQPHPGHGRHHRNVDDGPWQNQGKT